MEIGQQAVMTPRGADARVIVTGAARGIGRGIALMFAAEGAAVAGVDVLDQGETALLAGDLYRPFACDLADAASIPRLFDALDGWFAAAPTVLCNVAAIGPVATLENTSADLLDRVYAINVRAPFLCMQEAAKRMVPAGGGRIVNIVSTASVQGFWGQSAYCASKGALSLLTRALAIELAGRGVMVNAVGPGTSDTPATATYVNVDEWTRPELDRTPIRRFGRPEDVAAAVRFLAFDATWMTGQTIYVDGGFLATGGPAPAGH